MWIGWDLVSLDPVDSPAASNLLLPPAGSRTYQTRAKVGAKRQVFFGWESWCFTLDSLLSLLLKSFDIIYCCKRKKLLASHLYLLHAHMMTMLAVAEPHESLLYGANTRGQLYLLVCIS